MTTKPNPDALADAARIAADEPARKLAREIFKRGWECGQFAKGRRDAGDYFDFWASDEQDDLREQLAALRAHSPEASRVGERAAVIRDLEASYRIGGESSIISAQLREAALRLLRSTPSEPVSPAREEVERHVAAILEEWDMKEPPNAFTGHSYDEIARDIVSRALSALQPGVGERYVRV